ncbi:alpha-hydroxy acid oxidase [Oceanobacillus saliphilus]|uniref:alpha-hydroxy acid oxidase n=1 Tax=Oceanobacillus saliphilus TaxID=2925834 RepID=UPI00201DA0DC|nr:alpha-hydroxy acid oxidase [Oceanobacillus saliphilus]
MKNIPAKIQSVNDALYYARKRVPRGIMNFYEGGSGAGVTARRNEEAFTEIEFLPRAATFNRTKKISTTVLGHEISMPVMLSSVGALRAGHVDGERAATRAAGTAGTIQIVSGVSTTSIEDIMAEATGPVFQQLYFIKDRDMTVRIIERAKAAGVHALVLIADSAAPNPPFEIPPNRRASPPMGVNFKEVMKFAPQLFTKIPWAFDFLRNGLKEPMAELAVEENGEVMKWFDAASQIFDPTPTWEDLKWIREIWDGPIVMKGIVSVESAKRAVDEGVDAIIVSNHGGNMLDTTISSIEALPSIIEAVGDKIEVYMDGGIRRGTDVIKALALGARAVSLGRAYIFPLMAAGESGIDHILTLFRSQINDALGHLGVESIDELDPSILKLPPHWRKSQWSEGLLSNTAQTTN